MDAILTALSFVAMGIGGLSLVSAVSLAFVLAWDKAAAEFKEFKASQSRAQRVLDAHFRQALEVANSGRAGREQADRDRAICEELEKQWQA